MQSGDIDLVLQPYSAGRHMHTAGRITQQELVVTYYEAQLHTSLVLYSTTNACMVNNFWCTIFCGQIKCSNREREMLNPVALWLTSLIGDDQSPFLSTDGHGQRKLMLKIALYISMHEWVCFTASVESHYSDHKSRATHIKE